MPGIDSTAPNAGTDELDRMLEDDYVDRLFDDIERDAQASGRTTAPAGRTTDLGIDEQIKVTKQRKPVPKLDENLLLTQNGIPKLQRLARQKLKFKGKGHEFSDVARMLNLYQLWLDDLYPRAKFADSIAMVEKAGHGKRMQVMRKEWINEGKPKDVSDAVDTVESVAGGHAADDATTGHTEGRGVIEAGTEAIHQRADSPDLFLSDDEPTTLPVRIAEPETNGEPADDELDALLADAEEVQTPAPALANKSTAAAATSRPPDDFADEMEAMADMDMW